MKTWHACLGLLVILLWTVGCRNTVTQPTITAPTSVRTSTSEPTSTNSPTPFPQQTNTVKTTPTKTPESLKEWSDTLSMITIEGESVAWAPSKNVLLFESKTRWGSQELRIAAAPDFKSLSLAPSENYPNEPHFETLLWSPDSKKILYVGPGKENFTYQIFVMDADGKNNHLLKQDLIWNKDIWLQGWLDQNNLIFTPYGGGGHLGIGIINIQTRQIAPWGAFIHGSVFRSHNGYIPATTSLVFDYPQILVISEKIPSVTLDESIVGGNIMQPPLYHSIPRQSTTSVFCDWRPNSNQMLFSWKHINLKTGEDLDNDLLLWDVENNILQVIAPDGLGGIFSPDGKRLAYITYNSANVDDNHAPVKDNHVVTEYQVGYMHVLEMDTGKVQISIPILTDNDMTLLEYQEPLTMRAEFSPNSRYLAFLTPGKLKVNPEGLPVPNDDIDATFTTINVIDLIEKKRIWSAASDNEAFFSWSPTSSLLIFQDEARNWQLLNMDDFQISPITKMNGEYVFKPAWSFDGHYLSLTGCLHLSRNECPKAIRILDVLQEK